MSDYKITTSALKILKTRAEMDGLTMSEWIYKNVKIPSKILTAIHLDEVESVKSVGDVRRGSHKNKYCICGAPLENGLCLIPAKEHLERIEVQREAQRRNKN